MIEPVLSLDLSHILFYFLAANSNSNLTSNCLLTFQSVLKKNILVGVMTNRGFNVHPSSEVGSCIYVMKQDVIKAQTFISVCMAAACRWFFTCIASSLVGSSINALGWVACAFWCGVSFSQLKSAFFTTFTQPRPSGCNK